MLLFIHLFQQEEYYTSLLYVTLLIILHISAIMHIFRKINRSTALLEAAEIFFTGNSK